MKGRVRATGEIVDVEMNIDYTDGRAWYFNDDDDWETCEIEIIPEPRPEKAVLNGYIARDKNGILNLFTNCDEPIVHDGEDYWDADGADIVTVLSTNFPSVTWESGPRKVNIEITSSKEQ